MKKIILIFALLLFGVGGYATDYTQDANCVVAYLFTEGSGTTVDNAEGTADKDGSFKGTAEPAWDSSDVPSFGTSGSPAYSVHFDGTDDYIDCGTSGNWALNQDMTIVFWAKWDDAPSAGEVICATRNAWNWGSGFRLNYYAGGTRLEFDAGNETTAYYSPGSMTSWRHYAIVVDEDGGGTTATVSVYENGSLQTMTDASTSDLTNAEVNMYIGQYSGANGDPFDGRIAEFAIFDDILTSTEIGEIYNYGLGGGATPVVRPIIIMKGPKEFIKWMNS